MMDDGRDAEDGIRIAQENSSFHSKSPSLANIGINQPAPRTAHNRERNTMKTAILALAILSLPGCATIVRGTTQDVAFTSTPNAARVAVTTSGQTCSTPCALKLKRNLTAIGTISHEGYTPHAFALQSAIHGGGAAGMAGNLIVGGVIGIAVDATSGAMYDLTPGMVHADLKRAK
jgi:hypothetical protein